MELHFSMPNFDADKTVVNSFLAHYPAAAKSALRGAGMILRRHIKMNKLSGQVLNVRTGTLRRSVTSQLLQSRRTLRANTDSVATGSKVFYGAIWEKRGRSWLRSAFDDKRTEIFNFIRDKIRATFMR